jgi:hypothetical protein
MDTLLAKLEGVKFVRILETQDYIDVVKNQAGNAVSSPDTRILSGFFNWVNDYLKLGVAFTKEQTEASIKNVSSFCDYVNAQVIVHPLKQGFFSSYPVEIVFTFCDNSQYIFDMKVAAVAHNSLESETRSMLRGYLTNKNTYDRNKRLKVKSLPIIISEKDFIYYIDTCKILQKEEGIFELFSTKSQSSNYKVGIYNSNGILKMICFKGSDFSDDWQDGELKGILFNTKSDNDFLISLYSLTKAETKGSITFLGPNAFELRSKLITGVDKYVRIK